VQQVVQQSTQKEGAAPRQFKTKIQNIEIGARRNYVQLQHFPKTGSEDPSGYWRVVHNKAGARSKVLMIVSDKVVKGAKVAAKGTGVIGGAIEIADLYWRTMWWAGKLQGRAAEKAVRKSIEERQARERAEAAAWNKKQEEARRWEEFRKWKREQAELEARRKWGLNIWNVRPLLNLPGLDNYRKNLEKWQQRQRWLGGWAGEAR
jgi:hypothetical protein